MFTDQDLKQISERGISLETVEKQLAEIKKGFPFLKIEDAAAVGKGIMTPDESTRKAYLDKWAEYVGEGHRIVKFVPASGAASRMFKIYSLFLMHLMMFRLLILKSISSIISNISLSVRLCVRNARLTRA